jgi:hypothetical protein
MFIIFYTFLDLRAVHLRSPFFWDLVQQDWVIGAGHLENTTLF